MSPLGTFHNSGDSSRLLARRNRPRLVSLRPSVAGSSLASNVGRMLRSFIIANGGPERPGRVREKSTSEPRKTRTNNAVDRITGVAEISAKHATRISNMRLVTRRYSRPSSSHSRTRHPPLHPRSAARGYAGKMRTSELVVKCRRDFRQVRGMERHCAAGQLDGRRQRRPWSMAWSEATSSVPRQRPSHRASSLAAPHRGAGADLGRQM